jgi:hypothetical protein
MRQIVVMGLVAGLVVILTAEDVSGCGRRRHRSRECCPCSGNYTGVVTFNSDCGCMGGSGTNSDDTDTLVGAYLLQNSNQKKWTCTIDKHSYGGWKVSYADYKNLPSDTYQLCVRFTKAGTHCSDTFNCPPP